MNKENGRLPGHIVLLVEDDEMNRAIASRVMEKWALTVVQVQNGAEAVEEAARRRYDLILMDLQMPTMDGYHAARHIRLTQQHIPIIALTASAEPEIVDSIRSAGMNDYVIKPFQPKELFNKIAQHLNEIRTSPA